MQDNLDQLDDEPVETPTPWALLLRVCILLFSYLWIGPLTGSLEYSLGPKAGVPYAFLDTGIHFVFFVITVHVLLFWPVSQFVNPVLQKKAVSLRFLAWILLLCPPLLSFGYYLGHFEVSMDMRELCLSVFFPVLIGALFFEKTGKLWIFSLMVSIPVFISYFLVNDLLGPFQTLVFYATKNASVYMWRMVCPILAIFTGVFSLLKSTTPGIQSLKYRQVSTVPRQLDTN